MLQTYLFCPPVVSAKGMPKKTEFPLASAKPLTEPALSLTVLAPAAGPAGAAGGGDGGGGGPRVTGPAGGPAGGPGGPGRAGGPGGAASLPTARAVTQGTASTAFNT
jgi:hypothetical protein